MIRYRFLASAEEELTEASAFYEVASSGLGADLLDDVQRVINNVRAHPLLGRPVGHSFRLAVLHRFPFSLIYCVEADGILVVAVAHQKRRPGYWRDRTDET